MNYHQKKYISTKEILDSLKKKKASLSIFCMFLCFGGLTVRHLAGFSILWKKSGWSRDIFIFRRVVAGSCGKQHPVPR